MHRWCAYCTPVQPHTPGLAASGLCSTRSICLRASWDAFIVEGVPRWTGKSVASAHAVRTCRWIASTRSGVLGTYLTMSPFAFATYTSLAIVRNSFPSASNSSLLSSDIQRSVRSTVPSGATCCLSYPYGGGPPGALRRSRMLLIWPRIESRASFTLYCRACHDFTPWMSSPSSPSGIASAGNDDVDAGQLQPMQVVAGFVRAAAREPADVVTEDRVEVAAVLGGVDHAVEVVAAARAGARDRVVHVPPQDAVAMVGGPASRRRPAGRESSVPACRNCGGRKRRR